MAAPKTVVITGTDTGIGKTWVACALARALSAQGRRALAIKPLETGCDGPPSEAEDGVALARATGQTAPTSALVRLRAPVAPCEAADREGALLDFDALVDRVRAYAAAASAEITLVEGAGGLLSPLTWDRSALDLARSLGAGVLLVAPDRLGTINHVAMALQIVAMSGLPLLGLVLTAPEHADASTGTNARAISRVSGLARIHEAPRTTDPEAARRSMDAVIGWLD